MAQPLTQDRPLETFRDACRRLVAARVAALSGKFDPGQYVAREDAERAFQLFTGSSKRLFLVLGESGRGKTNLMCHLALQSAEVRPTVLASGFWTWEREQSLWDYVFLSLQVEVKPPGVELEPWFRSVLAELEETGLDFYVFIDAINETDDPPRFKRALRQALETTSARVRFVLSCRVDSFERFFDDPAWVPYLFRPEVPAGGMEKLDEARMRFAAQVTRRYERLIGEESQARLQEAMDRYRKEVLQHQAELSRNLVVAGSVLLDSFNELELAEAEERYGTVANLVGEARENCRDPLIFRLFADTLGRQATEVSEVFLLENCEKALKEKIAEVRRRHPDLSSQRIYDLLFEVAHRVYQRRTSPAAEPVTAASPEEEALLESLVDSGLLDWQGAALDGSAREITFRFDRILSFVLALDVSRQGEEAMAQRLSRISGERYPADLDLHLCLYLILLLDDPVRSGAAAWRAGSLVQHWVQTLLTRPRLREPVVRLLPVLVGWTPDQVFAVLDKALSSLRIERDYRLSVSQNFEYSVRLAYEDRSWMDACAEALAAMARKGYGERVVSFTEDLLGGLPEFEQRDIFHPLVKPLAVAFAAAPEQIVSILERLCLPEEPLAMDPSLGLSPGFLRSSALETLGEDVRRFPAARLELVRYLARNRHPLLRQVAIQALPGLAVSNPGAAEELIFACADDPDGRVRTSLTTVLPNAGGKLALEVCQRLWEDRDSAVRAALAAAAVQLYVAGDLALQPLLQGLLTDEAFLVRSAFAKALAEAWVKADGPAQEMLAAFIDEVADDPADEVRSALLAVLATSSEAQLPKALAVVRRILTAESSASFKLGLIAALDRIEKIESRLSQAGPVVVDDLLAIARRLAEDRSSKVRAEAVDLVFLLLGPGPEGARELLAKLLADREVLVRLKVLERDLKDRAPEVGAVLRTLPPEAPANGSRAWPRHRYTWIQLSLDAVRDHLAGGSRLRWYVEILGAASAFLATALFLVPLAGWQAPWLGGGLSEAAAADPRRSLLPVLLGAAVAFPASQLIQLLTMKFHCGFLRAPRWPFWLPQAAPPAGALLAYGTARATAGRETAFLVGLATFVLLELIATAAGDWLWRRPRQSWFGQSALFLLAAGAFSGALAGALASWTFLEVYAPACILLCISLLSLPIGPLGEQGPALFGGFGLVIGGCMASCLAAGWVPLQSSGVHPLLERLDLTAHPDAALFTMALALALLNVVFSIAEDSGAGLVAVLVGPALGLLSAALPGINWITGLYVGALLALAVLAGLMPVEKEVWFLPVSFVFWLPWLLASQAVSAWLLPAWGLLAGALIGLALAPLPPTENPLARLGLWSGFATPDEKSALLTAVLGALGYAPLLYGATLLFARLLLLLPGTGSWQRHLLPLWVSIALVCGLLATLFSLELRWAWRRTWRALSVVSALAAAGAGIAVFLGEYSAALLVTVPLTLAIWGSCLFANRNDRSALIPLAGLPAGSALLMAAGYGMGSAVAAHAVAFVTLLLSGSLLQRTGKASPG